MWLKKNVAQKVKNLNPKKFWGQQILERKNLAQKNLVEIMFG